jgi:chemotaxis protein CheX
MQAKIINPFIEATGKVFKSFFNVVPVQGAPALIKRDTVLDFDISGIIGIAGESKGAVVVSFTEATILKLVEKLEGRVPTKIDEGVVDTVGEIINIIAGNAKQGLEDFKLVISLPSVVQGKSHQIHWPVQDTPIMMIPFTVPEGTFGLTVTLKDGG